MRRVAVVLFGVWALGACGNDDGGSSEEAPSPTAATAATVAVATAGTAPSTSAAPSTTVPGRRPEGFGLVRADVTLADGSVCELCLWLADTSERRQRGLMHVTDLSPADGMVFVYETASTSAFWMRDTVMPLSIVFFAPDGTYISSADMTPCLTGPDSDCERYPPAGAFTMAVEFPLGRPNELGIGAGSRIELLGAVDSCPD